MCTSAFRALAALSLAALASLSGCVDADDDAGTGTVSINLVGQGTSGATYRLRDATLTVDGPAPTVWHTEDDPDRTSLSANVPAGNYSATLAPGWRLERLAPGMPPADVTATLTSPNPFLFEVTTGERASVQLRFAAGGDVIDMTTGYDVTIGVDDLGTNLVVTPANLTVIEGGTAVFSVRLASAPSVPVTVNVLSSDPSAAATMPSTLTFTPANYATAQTVTAFAVPDADANSEMVILTLQAPGLPTAIVTLIVQDTTVQALQVSTPNLTLTEGGAATFTVRLAAQPSANVVVNVASSDATAAVVTPATLTFTPANYSTMQAVTVSGVADADLVNEAATLTVTSAGLAPASVAVTVNDDDVQSIVVQTPSVVLVEGGTAPLGVRLAFQPAAPVTIQIVSSDNSAAMVSPSAITFTPGNWSTNQNVTITAPQDPDNVDEDLVIQLLAPGIPTRIVDVSVADNDVFP